MINIFNRIKAVTKRAYTNGQPDRKGLVFIPDISGFTELVGSTDQITGRSITYELLSSIIQNNKLDLEVAEIEGDAVFFFKWQQLPDTDEIMEQFKAMKTAFDQTRATLEIKYNLKLNLELKAVAHYGPMSEYYLGGFRKLYGQVVVEAHRLLKNKVPQTSYLLITDELSEACAGKDLEILQDDNDQSSRLCEIYQDLRNICYSYTSFEKSFATN
ncbi:DUF2652 domain-containing protein [Desertivirga brevis]|uniref:DUF2652 domain-containing protein n=1 Tax=Desertivirga brevis TaxID=2810310 RepID=UPI001A95666F|nr:DUF2652 domain-containing protein [Pedobacter sp. SYSU D00873]